MTSAADIEEVFYVSAPSESVRANTPFVVGNRVRCAT